MVLERSGMISGDSKMISGDSKMIFERSGMTFERSRMIFEVSKMTSRELKMAKKRFGFIRALKSYYRPSLDGLRLRRTQFRSLYLFGKDC